MRQIASVVLALLLASCAYPTSTVQQGSMPGELFFPAAQAGARVEVDGVDAGLASAYNGVQTLAVAPGPHRVIVRQQNRIIIDRAVYIDAGAKVAVGG
jgi:hypothetical protein